jgi:outer membrane protein assembly factor BamB
LQAAGSFADISGVRNLIFDLRVCPTRAVGCRLAVLLVASLTASRGAAADWPQWRGPNRDGKSADTGLLKTWPAGGPPLAWKATGLGRGYSGVTLAGDRIYTMGDFGETNLVLALRRADGKRLWSTPLGKAGAPGWGGFAGPRSSVTVDGDRLYALGQYGEFACLEAATGQVRWRRHLTDDFGGERPEWGFSESPLVDGPRVVLTPGGSQGAVVALDKMTGALLWQTKEFKDPAHYSSLIAVELGGVRQYVQLTAEHVVGIVPEDGRVMWESVRPGRTAVITTPVAQGNLVYVTSGYGVGCNVFGLTRTGEGFNAEEVYANKEMANHHGGVILRGNHVYGHSEGKGWTCQELRTGKAVWQDKEILGKGSIAFADGLFYLRREDGPGTVVLAEVSPTGVKEKGRFDQPERTDQKSWTHPVIAGGCLYLRDQDLLLCYDVRQR